MRFLFFIISLLFLTSASTAQQSRFFFRKLTVSDGLNDGAILAISQDSQGFMWFSSRAGLNRFDGHSVKNYSHIAGDTTSIPTSLARAMCADSSGRFFVGLEKGMLEYNAATDRFTSVQALNDTWVGQIVPVSKTAVYLSTPKGLVKYDPVTKSASFFRDQANDLFKARVFDIVRHNDALYLASGKGLLRFDIKTGDVQKVQLPIADSAGVTALAIDNGKNLWLALAGKAGLVKVSPNLKRYEVYGRPFEASKRTIDNFTYMITDKKGRLWVTTQLDGLMLYNPQTNTFEQFLHDPLKIWTPSTNLHSSVYCDREGAIWVGGNNGINYFNPDKSLFSIIPSFDKEPDIRNRRVARIAVEDKNGKLWFGTIDGLVKFDPLTNSYREWNNREGKPLMIHFNSVRGLLCDDENNIWVATGRGINKYVQKENKMVFYTAKDSIPEVFYFSADKDRAGNSWFSSRDGDGFYYFDAVGKKFHSIRSFPGLSIFAGHGGRKLFHDSKGRYWLGFNGSGVGMYDPAAHKHYHWRASTANNKGIAGDAVVDIKEDKKGIIWISTFTGLTAIDPATFAITNYNHTNGLVNSSTSALAVDEQNRLWIGTGAGLMLLDSSRKYFTFFGLQHGLPSIEFPEHASSLLPGGDIMMPTQNGFVRFTPGEFTREHKALTPFFTNLTLPGKQAQLLSSGNISLHHDENFFTIGFAAIDFENAAGTWYAYKLDGVDETWKYTQNRFADYTQIPGGNYTFRVKAAADREEWKGPEKILRIHIATVYYKTWWFRLLMLLTAVALAYLVYGYRIRHEKKLLKLESKTQLLEKEKAMVMFESLKQQLNPHFLFNSLTSLSGLIETDHKMANSFLEQMSRIYRYILKNRDSELVSLKEELAFVRVYINLQKTRFKEGLQVTINVDEEELHKKIAPVTLQNLVENAIKHNIIDADTPLMIDITNENGYLSVTNRLQKKNMVETSNKQGLASLRSLYKYLSGRPLIVEETASQFIVRIPLI
jgi:ligand-binding sensor domain-containing protein